MTLRLSLMFLAFALLAPAAEYLMYVGTYTGPDSKGIYLYRFQPATGEMTSLGLAGEAANPSFLAFHPSGDFLYSVDEDGKGMVSAFKVDRKTGKLTRLNSVSSHGSAPCALEVDATGRNLLVANYEDGVVALMPIRSDGSLEEAAVVDHHKGSSVRKENQSGPHAHSTNFAPGNRFALVADLGMDRVFVYRFDAAKHTLTPNEAGFGILPPGSGPRHVIFHPNGKLVYVVSENTSTVTTFAWDGAAGTLKALETISGQPKDWSAKTDGAEIQVHPSAKFVYSSNRADSNNISTFRVTKKGTLEFAGVTPSGGKSPRYFGLDPTGVWMIAANEGTDNLTLFRVDASTGKLTPAGKTVHLFKPVCVKFLAVK
ncbi:MAG TPA: lactonase family protein [Bryobacteraceae bacterium]